MSVADRTAGADAALPPRTATGWPVTRDVRLFFVLAFAITWSVWVPAALVARGDLSLPVPSLALYAVGGLGPLLAAVALSARAGRGQVRALVAQLDPRRVPRRWFLAPLLLAVTNLAPVGGFLLGGGHLPDAGAVLGLVLVLPVQVLLVAVVGGGLDEETGWRGYALPRLLWRVPPVAAHAVLGVVWACWHLPLWLDAGSSQAAYPFAVYLVITVGQSVLIGWMYCASGGSLLIAVLAHAVSNSTDGLRYGLLEAARSELAHQLTLMIVTTAAAVVVVAATQGRLGADRLPPPPLSAP